MLGSLFGFMFKKLSHKFSDIVLSFAAGVMLAASVLGLILPSLEYGGKYGIIITIIAALSIYCIFQKHFLKISPLQFHRKT